MPGLRETDMYPESFVDVVNLSVGRLMSLDAYDMEKSLLCKPYDLSCRLRH